MFFLFMKQTKWYKIKCKMTIKILEKYKCII